MTNHLIPQKSSLVKILAVGLFVLAQFAHAETAALQHDNNGNVTQRSVANGVTTQTTTYTYDALNRLTGESGSAKTQTLAYDENGNRKSDGAGNYIYETTSNRMSTRLGLAVTYDAVGRLTADGTGKTFSYNQAGQLYQVKQGGTLIATYTYDYRGLRISKETTASAPQGVQAVVYIYDQWGKIMEEFTGSGTLIRSYIWRDDTPVVQIEHTTGGDKILYFEVDHLNTPRAAMDETGKVVWRWESDAFGSSLPDEDPDKDGVKVTVNLRFPGQYYDAESGLNYNWNRYYIPELGRYTTSDPIGLIGGVNTYTYVEGNPVGSSDPEGLIGPLGAFLLRALGIGLAANSVANDPVPLGVAGAIGGAVNSATNASSIANKICSNATHYGPLNSGPLASSIANTFRSSTYSGGTLARTQTMYRVIGPNGNPAGSYWTTIPPTGPVASTINSALLPQWGNNAAQTVTATIPAGTNVYVGIAGQQGGLVGGGVQVYIPQVNPSWISGIK